jgi:hypothetical protein
VAHGFRQLPPLTSFGLLAVTAMLISYALEKCSRLSSLGFVVACAKGAIYGFLQSAWPVGLVEGVWSVLALRPSSVAQPSP